MPRFRRSCPFFFVSSRPPRAHRPSLSPSRVLCPLSPNPAVASALQFPSPLPRFRLPRSLRRTRRLDSLSVCVSLSATGLLPGFLRLVCGEPHAFQCLAGTVLRAGRKESGRQETDLSTGKYAVSLSVKPANFCRKKRSESKARGEGKGPSPRHQREGWEGKKGGGSCGFYGPYHRQDPPDRIGRLGADAEPVASALDIDLDLLLLPHAPLPHLSVALRESQRQSRDRVVGPQDFQGQAVARAARLRQDDVVDGAVAAGAGRGRDAGEAEFEDHGVSAWRGWRGWRVEGGGWCCMRGVVLGRCVEFGGVRRCGTGPAVWLV